MVAYSFIDRGYPQDLVESAMVRARRKNREDTLRVEDRSEKNQNSELIYLITTFNPGSNILGNIVKTIFIVHDYSSFVALKI